MVVVVVGVANGRGGCGRCWVVFLGSGIYYFIVGIYYFIVMFILFYYVDS